MTTASNDTEKLAVLKRGTEKAVEKANAEAQAALEQMFGYFSFAPMPTEHKKRLAA